jgi:hypothetical protein
MRSSPRPGVGAVTVAALLFLGRVVLIAGPASAAVVERVLASVDGRPVLLSEAQAFAALRGMETSASLDALIDERLMYREASRLPGAAASAAVVAAAEANLKADRPEALARLRPVDLRALLRRQIVILRYIELRFRPQVRIGEDVVREAYDAEYAGRPSPPPYSEVAAEIEERLVRKDLDSRIEAWVRELRSGVEIRYNP